MSEHTLSELPQDLRTGLARLLAAAGQWDEAQGEVVEFEVGGEVISILVDRS